MDRWKFLTDNEACEYVKFHNNTHSRIFTACYGNVLNLAISLSEISNTCCRITFSSIFYVTVKQIEILHVDFVQTLMI